jgi:hypothetical protein
MRKQQLLHAVADYLPFLGMLVPTLLVAAVAAILISGAGRPADAPDALEAIEIRAPAFRAATERATRQPLRPLLKCAAWGEGEPRSA